MSGPTPICGHCGCNPCICHDRHERRAAPMPEKASEARRKILARLREISGDCPVCHCTERKRLRAKLKAMRVRPSESGSSK